MSNSQTEHSKKLRAKTAAQWNRQQLASGAVRQLVLKAKREVVDEFDAIAKAQGLSRPQALKMLCEYFRAGQMGNAFK